MSDSEISAVNKKLVVEIYLHRRKLEAMDKLGLFMDCAGIVFEGKFGMNLQGWKERDLAFIADNISAKEREIFESGGKLPPTSCSI